MAERLNQRAADVADAEKTAVKTDGKDGLLSSGMSMTENSNVRIDADEQYLSDGHRHTGHDRRRRVPLHALLGGERRPLAPARGHRLARDAGDDEGQPGP